MYYLLQDVSLRLPADSITVIVSPTNTAGNSDVASDLLSLLWQRASPSGAKNREGSVQQLEGTIFVQGRKLIDWHKEVLSEQFTYLSAEEEPLRIHAGKQYFTCAQTCFCLGLPLISRT